MKTIQLTGKLAKEFGPEFKLDVASPAEGVRALCYMVDGFEAAIKQGWYKVVRVYENNIDQEIDATELALSLGRCTGFRIEPVISGAKKAGVGKIIIGAVLIGAAFYFSGGTLGLALPGIMGSAGLTYGSVALLGGLLLVSGVSTALSPSVSSSGGQRRDTGGNIVDERTSFLFEGPRNVVEQGHPIPLVYGRMHTGSIMVSAGISAESI